MTVRLEGGCSIQLSYGRLRAVGVYPWYSYSATKAQYGGNGVADGSRTRHLRSHNPVLYLMSYGHHRMVLKTGTTNSPFCD